MVAASATTRRTATPISDAETLERIRELAIPPAWKEVWICPAPERSHPGDRDRRRRAQAVPLPPRLAREPGPREVRRDDRLRRALPTAAQARRRRTCRCAGSPASAVLAGAVRLLDLGFFRVGSDQYTAENETYGLSTLRRRHVRFEDGARGLRLQGEGRQAPRPEARRPERREAAARPQAAATAAATSCSPSARAARLGRRQGRRHQRLPEGDRGRRLLAPRTSAPGTRRCSPRSALRRTQRRGPPQRRRRRASGSPTRSSRTSPATSPTRPAVCRASYIDPRVFDRFDSGTLHPHPLRRVIAETGPDEFADREEIEAAVLRLLE